MDIKKINEIKKLNGGSGNVYSLSSIEEQYYKELDLNFNGENNTQLVQKLHCMWQFLQKYNMIINIYEDGVKVAGDSIESKREFVLWEDLEILVNQKCKLMNGNIEEMNHDESFKDIYLEELYKRVHDLNVEENNYIIQGLHCIWQLKTFGLNVESYNSLGCTFSGEAVMVGDKPVDRMFLRWSSLEKEIVEEGYTLLS